MEMNNLEIKDITTISLQQEATELHRQILANGLVAASSIIEMCRCLKQMRDNKQYVYLGYDTFDAYVEEAVKIKSRQAYNYISAYEKLGPEMLQSNANMGITKLKMLSEIPESKRAEVLETEDIENMSTREMKELVAKLTKAQEQISMLSEDNENAHDERNKAQDEVEELQKTIEKLKNAQEIPPETINELKKEHEADLAKKIKATQIYAEAGINEKIEAAKKEAKAAADKELNESREKLRQAQAKLREIEQEKEESQKRSSELEKRVMAGGGSDAQIVDFLFGEFSAVFNKIVAAIEKIPEGDRPKYKNAMRKYFEMNSKKLEDEI